MTTFATTTSATKQHQHDAANARVCQYPNFHLEQQNVAA
jgi:hypothetical protein